MVKENEQSEKRSYWPSAVLSTVGGLATAWATISHYAHEQFAALGHFKEADKALEDKIKAASPKDIAHSIKNTYRDPEGMGLHVTRPGLLDKLEHEYEQDVSKVFESKNAAGTIGKWKHALTDRQKNKVIVFSGAVTVLVAAVTLLGIRGWHKQDSAEKSEGTPQR